MPKKPIVLKNFVIELKSNGHWNYDKQNFVQTLVKYVKRYSRTDNNALGYGANSIMMSNFAVPTKLP